MIIDNTYFKNKIYIANAKPSVNSSVKGIAIEVQYFIDEYTRDCLIKSLGYSLFLEFESQLDDTSLDGLLPTADQKWDDLLNGKTYTNPDGKTVIWRGIRFKSNAGNDYDTSFLANYTYFFYEQSTYINKSNNSSQIPVSKNATTVKPTLSVTVAWNDFVRLVQGEDVKPAIINRPFGIGVDYYNGGQDISMYKFIEDSNTLVEDTYPDFEPKCWTKLNQFGI